MLAPDKVSVPEPVLDSASAPVVLRTTPLNTLVWSLPPTVKVAAPAALLSTVPAPLKPLTVSLTPFRSSVPATATLPLPAPSGSTPAAPSLSVPALTEVSPL